MSSSDQPDGARVYERSTATTVWRLPQPLGPRTVARWLLVILALVGVAWFLRGAGSSATPFVVGLVLAYLLVPVVQRLSRFMPRWTAILVVYAVGLSVVVIAFTYLVPPVANQVSQFVDNVDDYVRLAETKFNEQWLILQQQLSPDIQAQINQQIQTIQQTLHNNATTYAQRVGTFLFSSVITLFQTIAFIIGFLVVPFFLFYILIDTKAIPNAINQLLHPRIRTDFWNVWRIIDSVLGNYIRGQLLLGAIIGSATFVGLYALRWFGITIPYVVLLSLVAGFGELIPVIGPILSAVPAILVAVPQGLQAVVAVILLFVIIQQLENQVLVPRIAGNTLRLHPALLMALLLLAAGVGGLVFVIVSAPLVAILRDVFVYTHRRLREPPWSPARAIGGLVAGNEEPAPPDAPQLTTGDATRKRTKSATG